MACGIEHIPIGKAKVSAGLLQQALKATKGITNLNAAIAKSYAIVKKSGVDLDAWEAYYIKFNDPEPVGALSREQIFNDPKKDFDSRFEKLVNLIDYDTSGYAVGNYAKRVFNRVRANLVARGKGLTTDQIETMRISLRSVLTKDKIHQDANKLRTTAKKNLKTKLGANTFLKGQMEKLLKLKPEFVPADQLDIYYRLLEEFGQHKKVLSLRDSGVIAQELHSLLERIPEHLFQQTQKAASQVEEVPVEIMASMVKNRTVNPEALENPDEIKWAKKIQEFTKEQLMNMESKDLQVVLDSIDSINNGVFPSRVIRCHDRH